MRIGIANDHTAVEYKREIANHIREKYGYEVVNYGTDLTESYDYPLAGERIANAVATSSAIGGQTMDQALVKLVRSGQITRDTALRYAHETDYVKKNAI